LSIDGLSKAIFKYMYMYILPAKQNGEYIWGLIIYKFMLNT
jgi:hypothetical protein